MNDALSDHRKVKNILTLLENSYVPRTDVTARLYKNAIDDIISIDSFKSDREAANNVEAIITAIIEQSSLLNLHNYDSRLRDPELIAKLFSKISTHALLKQYKSIYTREASRRVFTFAEVCQEIRDELVSIREGFRTNSTQPVALVNPTSPDISSSLQSSVSAAKYPTPTDRERPRWNCQGAHKNADCPAAFCRNCHKMFSTTRDPAYHLFTQCSQRPPLKQPGPGKRQSATFDKPQFKKVNAATTHAADTSESENENEEYYDNNSSFCAMMCHRTRRFAPEVFVPTQQSNYAMVDSGTNIHLASYKHAQRFSVEVITYDRPHKISFGNGTTTYSKHYAYFGVLIGNVSLLHDAPDFC